MKPFDLALAALAAARVTRFVSTDTLGDWLIVQPAKKWAARREGATYTDSDGVPVQIHSSHEQLTSLIESGMVEVEPQNGWRSKLVSGLECPFCVGFWIGAATLTAAYLVDRQDSPRSRTAYRLAAGSLGMNYMLGHVQSRID